MPLLLRKLGDALPWVLLIGLGLYAAGQMQAGAALPAGTPIGELLTAVGEDLGTDLPPLPGEVVVLNFWATWCGPCKKEGPVLGEIAAGGVRVIGISVDRMALEHVVDRARQFGMTYEIGVGSRKLIERFGVDVVPTTYVIAPDGVIVMSRAGYVSRGALLDAIETARKRG